MREHAPFAQAIRLAYLGNLVAVLFLSSAAPVILKAHNAPRGTLPLFATLPLFWSMRAVIVPPVLRYADAKRWAIQPLLLLCVLRAAVVVIFLALAASLPLMSTIAMIRTVLLGAGMVVCLLCGIERGVLDAGAVLLSGAGSRPERERFSHYEAVGAIAGSTLSSGMSIGLNAWLGLPACCAVMAGLVALLTLPVWHSTATAKRISSPRALSASLPSGPKTRLSRRDDKRTRFALLLLALVSGWLGLDLAYRVVQTLLLRQGLSLGWVGVVTVAVGIALLLLFAATQAFARQPGGRSERWPQTAGAWLPVGAILVLLAASVTGRPAVTIAGFLCLQAGYFFFSGFVTHLIILYGRESERAASAVFLSGASYFVAHFLVVPVLALTTSGTKGFVTTYAVATGCMILCVLIRYRMIEDRRAGAQ
ncbi:hypothetical protein [Acetobacter sp. P1H12_c]|uniref:hypothetical protein n=1 Tax=Acetobacter sp. P1H12_c TaxID=2762621 RepID=UPI001C043B97|nr:hypothetical protein [Acetobacter sp. P1H12_c]